MKTRLLTAATVLSAFFALSVSAQCPSTKVCTETTCDTVAGCYGPYSEIFAGLNLSADQQAALKALKPERKGRPDRKDLAQRADSVRADRQQGRRDYLNQVKNVLTPEQYVTFLEEVVVEGPNRPAPQRVDRMRRHDGRHAMHDRKAERLDRSEKKFSKEFKKAEKAQLKASK